MLLGSVVEVGKKPEKGNSLPADQITESLRQELQIFATRALRHELLELRWQIRQDLEEELHKLQTAHARKRQRVTSSSLRDAGRQNTMRESIFLANSVASEITPQPPKPPEAAIGHSQGSSRLRWAHERDKAKELSEEEVPQQRLEDSNFIEAPTRTRPASEAGRQKGLASKKLKSRSKLPAKFRKGPSKIMAPKVMARARLLESTIGICITLNGLFIGVQTDYQARNVTEVVPGVFPIMEIIFCIIFTSELITKLIFHRQNFFTVPGVWHWNVFDFLLVALQLTEVICMIASNHESSSTSSNPMGNLSFLRLLRILRLFRVLRLVRLLQFIGELATIISSIAKCFRALCYNLLLLLMMIYIVAIVITQLVVTHRVDLKKNGYGDSEDLAKWWGCLLCAMLSLYQATLGGVDWETVEVPLRKEMDGGPVLSVLFSLYIAFVVLAMMNIITGTFVQSALQNSEKEKAQDFRAIAWTSFGNEKSKINFEEFQEKLDDPQISNWLERMGISCADAILLFQLLNHSQLGSVDCDRLINNLIRLRDGARFMDILKLLYEQDSLADKFEDWSSSDAFELAMTRMSSRISEDVVSSLFSQKSNLEGQMCAGDPDYIAGMPTCLASRPCEVEIEEIEEV